MGERDGEGEERKFYPLTHQFFESFDSILMFDTPRQLERTVDLLTNIEWCYFRDVDIVDKYWQPEFAAFLVEMLRTFYESVCIEAGDNKGLYDLAKKFSTCYDVMVSSGPPQRKQEKDKEMEEWRARYPHSSKRCEKDMFLRSILERLSNYSEDDDISDNLDGIYARFFYMKRKECFDFIEECKGNVYKPMVEMMCDFYGSEEKIPENKILTVKMMVYFALLNLKAEHHCKFIDSLFRYELEGRVDRTDVFSFKSLVVCFFKVFTAYVKGMEEWEAGKNRLENLKKALHVMYRKLDLRSERYLLSRITESVNNAKNPLPLFSREEKRYEQERRMIKLDDREIANDCISDIQEICDKESFNEIVKFLCLSLVVNFLKKMNEDGEDWKIESDNISRLIEDSKETPYYSGFLEGCKQFRAKEKELRSDFLKRLLECLLCEISIEERNAPSQALTHVYMSNFRVFSDFINDLAHDEGQLNSFLLGELEKKIRVCKFSASYWRDDQSQVSASSRWKQGAEELWAVYQGLLEKKQAGTEE